MAKRRFKVGDLVTVHGLGVISFYGDIQNGTCAIVTEVLPEYKPGLTFNETFFFEYRVLIKGQEYYMFEEEMSPYTEEDAPCEACECTPCDCDWGIE